MYYYDKKPARGLLLDPAEGFGLCPDSCIALQEKNNDIELEVKLKIWLYLSQYMPRPV